MSVLGFPEELNFQSLKSMYPSRKTEYRKAPMNSQTVTNAGQDIQLVLSKMENTFYDPNTLTVNFTVDYNGITGGTSSATYGTAGTDGSFVLGCAYSHFSRQVVRPISGQPIETIDNPSLLVNTLLNMTTDSYEKFELSPSRPPHNEMSTSGRRFLKFESLEVRQRCCSFWASFSVFLRQKYS